MNGFTNCRDPEGVDMQYRDFGKLDWKTSALGFGCMRLPTTDDNPFGGNIEEGMATKMIRLAIDKGVNYIDTAYPYHEGKSEGLLGKVLKDGYREKVRLATKSPVWLVKEADDFDKYLNEQLERLQTDYIDFYLLHGLGKEKWEDTVIKLGLLDRAESAIKDGRIRYLGFSFHDDIGAFRTIMDGYDKWTFCQIQYNYMDTENQAGTEGLRYAASKGLAVIIMEPLLGGKLARPPKQITDILNESESTRTPADLALQWIWDQPEASLLLSGMSTMDQVDENLRSAEASGPNRLSEDERNLIERIQKKYREKMLVQCTKCGYCMPCSSGVEIPSNFELYNEGYMHEAVESSRFSYQRFLKEGGRASACTQCGECMDKCPQKIPIKDLMPKVHAVLGEDKPYGE